MNVLKDFHLQKESDDTYRKTITLLKSLLGDPVTDIMRVTILYLR